MPVLSIIPQRKRRGTSTVLSNELETPAFNITEAVLAGIENEFAESTQKYLQYTNAEDIDKQFNNRINELQSQFELQTAQLEEQSVDIQRQANIQEQDVLAQTSEGILGKLSTGAAVDMRQDIGKSVQAEAETAQSELAQYHSQLAEYYQSQIDETNELFAQATAEYLTALEEYHSNVELFEGALMGYIARKSGYNYNSEAELREWLVSKKILEQSAIDANLFTVTDKGQQLIQDILLNVGGDYGPYEQRITDLTKIAAESVMAEKYPSLTPDDSEYDRRLADLEGQFNEWLQQNAKTMYYTDLELATYELGQFTINKYSSQELSTENRQNMGITTDGVNVMTIMNTAAGHEELFGKFKKTRKEDSYQYDWIEKIITDAQTEQMSNGTYFAPNYAGGTRGTKLWYYENGYFYETDYDRKNLPPIITTDTLQYFKDGEIKISVSSTLGAAHNVFDTSGQGEYFNSIDDILDAINNGKCPEGAEITLNSRKFYYIDGKLHAADTIPGNMGSGGGGGGFGGAR